MTHSHSRIKAAVKRTFAEVNNAMLKLTAHNALCREDIAYTRMSFFVVAQHALHNDMVAHAIRVMDEHRDVSAFWYIHKCQSSAVEAAVIGAGSSLETLRKTSEKLRHIREKTHFHIDRTAVQSPASVWQSAGVTGDEFSSTLSVVAHAVSEVNVKILGGEPLLATEYDGSDIHRIVKAFEKVHGKVHGA
jgi:hypothetical protein